MSKYNTTLWRFVYKCSHYAISGIWNWHHDRAAELWLWWCDVTTALVRQNDVTAIVFVVRAMFIIFKFNIASAIRHFRYDIPAIRPLRRHNLKVAHPYGLRKCKRPTSDTYRNTELLKGHQICKIPTYMEETHVLLHTPIIIIHFS